MPVYMNVKPITYYPDKELVARKLFEGIEFTSILDVGAGHGGVFDLDRWERDPKVTRKEACDLFWIRTMPEGWITRLEVDACELDKHYQPNSFDFVQCCEVLEHIPDNKRALEQLVKVAKKAVFITSADEMHHIGPEQEAIEKFNKHQAYVGQPKIKDLEDLGFEVRVTDDAMRQIVAWLIKK